MKLIDIRRTRAMCVCMLVSVSSIHAQFTSSSSISFQAALNGPNGQPLPNGSYGLAFSFYSVPVGGVAIGNTNVASVMVSSGVASAVIPIQPSWFNGTTRYLGISINGGAELEPRTFVTAVPYAVYSDETRGILLNPPERFIPPIGYARPTNRVVIGTTKEDISRIPTATEALVIGTTNDVAGASVGVYFDTGSRAGSAIIVEKNSAGGVEDNRMHFYVGKEGSATSPKAVTISQNGTVGIGTPAQIFSRLVVGSTDGDSDRMPACHEAIVVGTEGNAGAGTRAGIYFDTNKRNGGGITVEKVNDGSNEDHRMDFFVTEEGSPNSRNCMTIRANGYVGIGTSNPANRLDVNGTASVKVLQITGGADLAEHFSVTDPFPADSIQIGPGMVVSIDPSGSRKFKLSDEPYDRKRVGIISGGNGVKPGLVLRDEGNPAVDGEFPVALTGQVWCQADASYGTIAPGDLLTTSATPGHAMRVTDFDKARFAVLGQALTTLKKGRGWVQVLVRPQ